MKPAKQIFTFVFLAAFLCIFIWFVDVRIVGTFFRQYQAQSYPKTEGQIVTGQITSHRGSKGAIFYHPAFTYTYTVNGLDYSGRRYRYDGIPSGYAAVDQIVESHPAGSSVDVYFNPNDPADTVLSAAVLTGDVAPIFLIAPITFGFMFMILKAGRQIEWPGSVSPAAGGIQILTDMMTTRVRLPAHTPGSLGWLAAGVVSFIASIAIHVVQYPSPVSAGLFAILVIFVVGVSVFLWQHFRLATGIQDLVLNEGVRTFELPLTFKRRKKFPLSYSDVKAVTLEKVSHRSRSGVSYTYAPTLQLRDGSSQQLIELNQKRGESFAAWLREKLGVPA
jgi:hypothetical protein